MNIKIKKQWLKIPKQFRKRLYIYTTYTLGSICFYAAGELLGVDTYKYIIPSWIIFTAQQLLDLGNDFFLKSDKAKESK